MPAPLPECAALTKEECAAVGGAIRLPLSYEQEQMWVLYQLDRSSGAYNVPHEQRWRGVLDMASLCGAVRAVARRHEVLRMRYGDGEDGRVFQRAVPYEEWAVGVREVTVGSEAEAMAEVSMECESSMDHNSPTV